MADPFIVKSAAEIRDDGLRSLRAGARRRGIPNLDTSPGSDYWNQFQAFGNEIEVLGAAQQTAGDAKMPDTATGPDLDDWLARVGAPPRRTAGGSAGSVLLDATRATYVPAGTLLVDALGQNHAVVVGQIYAVGAPIGIAAVATGLDTDRPAGEALRWVSAPIYAAATALVAPGGLTGASADEDDETARGRLLRRLQVPPGNGNATQVAELAESVSPLVQSAFVYPAVQGPATEHIALTGYTSATSKSRAIDPTEMAAVLAPAVVGGLIESAATVVTGTADYPADLAIDLQLPASGAASPPGPGGGWLDGSPWPIPPAGDSFAWCTLAGGASAFRVRASRPPVVGASRIVWVSKATWTPVHATVTSSVAVGGASPNDYDITVDTPFTGINVGDFLSPDAVNFDAYALALLAAFAQMGPGEKTANPTILGRAFRRPSTATVWPSDLSGTQLRAVIAAGAEVLDAAYRYRALTTPPLPATVTDPPNIFVPRNLAFYPLGGT
jgi:uncharacterized phage protein gp47/JayE